MPRFNPTKIDWTDFSWNPITGCLHNCPYCYARPIAEKKYKEGFKPTFRRQQLTAPFETNLNRKNKVFVGSMGDMFGHWVAKEWIQEVFEICKTCNWWTFIFLTKNPKRYLEFSPYPENFWIGTTVDKQKRVKSAEEAFKNIDAKVKFVSCEPLLELVVFENIDIFDWIIIGPMTKNGKVVKQPENKWISSLIKQGWRSDCKVFLKDKLDLEEKITEIPEVENNLLF